ncbi:TRAP transporter small permease [Roseomonas populi]|uniref:TRAP transporter small permease protein n=1 Tax=Roseomonas populi TaxID=3121582 RepID=A0ABT1X6T1_9PROT|nr:TRAP transporter small permease [Roseomonas pecuniae]MCR0983812.1 TRAP transporter small permease [Roseomonas pecuniae]
MERAFLFVNRFVCAVLLAASCTLVFANVVLRYGFGQSFAWAEEVSRYMVVWLAFLGSGLALRQGAHIAVETLPDALPEPAARLVRMLIVLLVTAFLVLLGWWGWDYAIFAWGQHSPVLRLSAGMVYLAVPVGCVLMLIHLALMAPGFVRQARSDEDKVTAAELGGAL